MAKINDDPFTDQNIRSAGIVGSISTLLYEGETLEEFVETLGKLLAEAGYEYEFITSGERQAFDWELPVEEVPLSIKCSECGAVQSYTNTNLKPTHGWEISPPKVYCPRCLGGDAA